MAVDQHSHNYNDTIPSPTVVVANDHEDVPCVVKKEETTEHQPPNNQPSEPTHAPIYTPSTMAAELELKEQMDVIQGFVNGPKNNVQEHYTRYYVVNKENHEDVYVDKHYNGMYMVGLAPSHPIRRKGLNVKEVTFDLGKRTASSFDVTGKKKGNAIKVQGNSKLCKIFIEGDGDTDSFIFEAGIKGRIIEINKRLLRNPKLLADSGDMEGWIAICECSNYQWSGRKNSNAKKRKIQNVEDSLLNESQYQQY
eukprot:277309_1